MTCKYMQGALKTTGRIRALIGRGNIICALNALQIAQRKHKAKLFCQTGSGRESTLIPRAATEIATPRELRNVTFLGRKIKDCGE